MTLAAAHASNLHSNKTQEWRTVLPVRGERQGVWCSKDMNVFLCPASAAALYRGLSPECHPSSAALLKLYNRDTHSFLGLAYVLHPLHYAASLQNGRTGSVASINWIHFQKHSNLLLEMFLCKINSSGARVRGALTMFVFLHLHAAVVNALDAAQAKHFLIDAQILESTQFYVYRANTVRCHGNKTCFID